MRTRDISITGAVLAAAALGLAAPARAQMPDWTQGWSGQATIYLWAPAISGKQQGVDGKPLVKLDNVSVLEALDMAFMGAAEVRKGKFGLLLDAVYADLSTDGTILQGRIDTHADTKIGFYTAAATYRLYEEERSFVDVYGGARYFDTKLSFSTQTEERGRSIETGLSWTDGIVGLRGGMPLSENWSLSGFADVGGFDAKSDLSWEVYGGANYAFAEHWAGTIGYRYVSITYEATSFATLDIDIHGPVLGISYKF